jgi:hypothetical protein
MQVLGQIKQKKLLTRVKMIRGLAVGSGLYAFVDAVSFEERVNHFGADGAQARPPEKDVRQELLDMILNVQRCNRADSSRDNTASIHENRGAARNILQVVRCPSKRSQHNWAL